MATPNSAVTKTNDTPRKRKLYPFMAAITFIMVAAAVLYIKYPNVLSMIPMGPHMTSQQEASFVELPQILINFNDKDGMRILRFSAQLEVLKKDQSKVTAMIPRIVDAMNGYLRGLEAEIMEEPGTLVQIRHDLLIRTQVVVGEDLVKKFLIKEFIIQ